MLLMGASSFAKGWELPAPPASVDPASDNQYYIMNIGAGQFLNNDKVWFNWNTTAALKDDGQLCTLNETAGVWTIMRNDGKFTFISGPANGRGEMHVDGASATNFVFQKIENVYHILVDPTDKTYGISEQYQAPLCWGWMGYGSSPVNAIIGNLDPADENNSCDWLFMDPEGYEAFKQQQPAYQTALKSVYYSKVLKAAIDELLAAYPSIDVTEELAVYNNEDGSKTYEDIQKALASVDTKKKDAIAAEAMKNASVENPIDMTSSINNPDFEPQDNYSGWSGTGFGSGGTKSTCAERYQMKFDTYQDLTNLPNGVFMLNVDGFYRAGSAAEDFLAEKNGTTYNSFLYGINQATAADTAQTALMHLFHGINSQPGVQHMSDNSEPLGSYSIEADGQKWYCPNSMLDFTNYNGTTMPVSKPYYKTNSVLIPVTEGKLRLGLKNETTIGWTIVDNFGLTYYGNGADAYGLLGDELKKSFQLPADILCTKDLKAEYDAVVAAINVTNYEGYKAAIAAVSAKKAEVDANVAAWNRLKAATDLAEDLVNNPDYEGLTGDLSDLVSDARDAMDLEDGLELSIEDIEEMIEELMAEYESVKRQTKPNTNLTQLIVNPSFAQGTTGWTLYNPTNKTLAVNASAKCAEAYDNGDFDIYQLITGAPAGVYEMTVQGFTRPSRDKEAWLKHFDNEGKPLEHPTDSLDAFIYMNDALNRLPSVFTYQTYTKDSIYKGTNAWADDLEYAPEGDTTVYKSTYSYPNDMASAGLAFSRGAYETSAFGLVAEGETMRIGMKGSIAGPNWAIFTNFKLIYRGFVPEYVQPMLEANLAELNISNGGEEDPQIVGADVYAAAMAAKQKGEEALTTGDGKKMYEALCDILPVINKIIASKAQFVKLMEAYENLLKSYAEYADARVSVRTQAEALQAEIENNLVVEKSYNDEDIPAVIDQINAIIAALAVPGDIENATAEEPCDVTGVLVNPSFETGNLNGWTSENFQTQSNSSMAKVGTYYCERWHADLNLKLSQQLTQKSASLPEGTYGISVLCAYTSVEEIGDLAYLYVADVDTTAFTSTDAMNPSRIEIKFNLHENDTITFGVNSQLTASTWCVFDDFQLWYYGASTDGIETLEAKKSEKIVAIYDINGIKVSGLKSGVNLVRTMDAKGKLQTRKIIVK